MALASSAVMLFLNNSQINQQQFFGKKGVGMFIFMLVYDTVNINHAKFLFIPIYSCSFLLIPREGFQLGISPKFSSLTSHGNFPLHTFFMSFC